MIRERVCGMGRSQHIYSGLSKHCWRLTRTQFRSRYRHAPESPMRVVTGSPLTPAPVSSTGQALSHGGGRGKRPCRYIPLVTYKVGTRELLAAPNPPPKANRRRQWRALAASGTATTSRGRTRPWDSGLRASPLPPHPEVTQRSPKERTQRRRGYPTISNIWMRCLLLSSTKRRLPGLTASAMGAQKYFSI